MKIRPIHKLSIINVDTSLWCPPSYLECNTCSLFFMELNAVTKLLIQAHSRTYFSSPSPQCQSKSLNDHHIMPISIFFLLLHQAFVALYITLKDTWEGSMSEVVESKYEVFFTCDIQGLSCWCTSSNKGPRTMVNWT